MDATAKAQAAFDLVAPKLAALPGAVAERYQDPERGIWRVEIPLTADVIVSAEWTGGGRSAELYAGGYCDWPATLSADELRAVAAALVAVADCLTPAATPPAPPARPPEP